MDSKSGLGSMGDREICAFKFSPLPCFFEFFCVHFGGF